MQIDSGQDRGEGIENEERAEPVGSRLQATALEGQGLADRLEDRDAVAAETPPDLSDPSLYLNRELSWLEFNDRVLQLAEDETLPLLERVKFCAIYTTNLDEFYMVRVAGLRDQIDAGVEKPSQDGLIPSETIALIRERVLEQSGRLTDCFEGRLRPALDAHDIRVVGVSRSR